MQLLGSYAQTFLAYDFCSELFRVKYDNNWVHMYELAKVSLNNRGNELKSNERRSVDGNSVDNSFRSQASDQENQPPEFSETD